MELRARLPLYLRLIRFDRPIGTFLLLWPTWWGLWFAAQGRPSLANLLIFTAGVFLMRSAGCVANDYADRHIDGHVERTRERPLASGQLGEREALRQATDLRIAAVNDLTILAVADVVRRCGEANQGNAA